MNNWTQMVLQKTIKSVKQPKSSVRFPTASRKLLARSKVRLIMYSARPSATRFVWPLLVVISIT